MNNQKSLLTQQLREAQEMIFCILGDSEHAVMDRKNPHYDSANTAFRQLEMHSQNLLDQLEKLKRKTA